ncbi:MAG: class I SAM-dependent methyltransferase [Azoarcus sp.]|nr:class I SAM-dependent methyltransferase [Azoarcus sp.]
MISGRQIFKPEWPRIFLDNALMQAIATLPVKSGKCLNVGCGIEGRYRELLADYEVDGVDIAHPPQGKPMPWRYHRCDANKLPFADADFDLAVAIESFEHIEDNVHAIREIARTLKPGGWCILTTPAHWTWLFEFGRHGPHYYDLRALKDLIEKADLEICGQYAYGGAVFWCANLVKSWLSPFGIRLLGRYWWRVIDMALLPIYGLSRLTDRVLRFPASNWLVIAKKQGV